MPHIEFNDIYSCVHDLRNMTDESREMIEEKKAKEGVDDLLTEQFINIKKSNVGIAVIEVPREEIGKEITLKIDLAIAILAHCKDPGSIDDIVKYSTLLGRHHGGRVEKNLVYPALKAAFTHIEEDITLHKKGDDDRKMIRKKIQAAISIINDSFSHKDSEI